MKYTQTWDGLTFIDDLMTVEEILRAARKALYGIADSGDECDRDKARTAIQALWLIDGDMEDIDQHHKN